MAVCTSVYEDSELYRFGGDVAVCGCEPRCCAVEDGLGGEGGEWSLFGGLPNNGVPADKGECGVPAPDGDGKVESGDDAYGAQGVPGLHHAVAGPLGGESETG